MTVLSLAFVVVIGWPSASGGQLAAARILPADSAEVRVAQVQSLLSADVSAWKFGPAPMSCQPESRDAHALFPDAPEVVRVLDGKVIENEEDATLAPEMTSYVWIMCDAVDLYEIFGIKARRGAVITFTRPGPEAALKASLDTLAALQDACRAREGTFATRLSDLGWTDPSGLI